jgi:DNA invertase Pin-like site-specific DNA recombinase
MATRAYLRVSTDSQDVANQKRAILEYARRKRFTIDDFVEVQFSSRKNSHQPGIESMLARLTRGDRLIVSELSRLGRTLGQVVNIVDELVKRKISFTAIKEGINFEGKQDLQTKVMIGMFELFAEVERDLIFERTREISERTLKGLAAARAKGRRLGRPKGSLSKSSKLGGKEDEIRMLLQEKVPKATIARILGVSQAAVHRFIERRGLVVKVEE